MIIEWTKPILSVVETGAAWTMWLALLTLIGIGLQEPAPSRVRIPQQLVESKHT